jgi:hypothetical protein
MCGSPVRFGEWMNVDEKVKSNFLAIGFDFIGYRRINPGKNRGSLLML